MKQVAQLTLAVQLPDDETFDSFKSDQNIISHLKNFIGSSIQTEKKANAFYLFGMPGVGKSHLLHASCTFASNLGKTSVCLSFSELMQGAADAAASTSVEVLVGLEQIDLICLDDLQLIAGNKDWQQAVFDLYNRVTEQNKLLLLSGTQSANQLGITLPDLVSRLTWGFTEQLKELDDADKLMALQYRAQQRGVVLQDDVAKFLLNRLSRDMSSLLSSLDKLDQASIREQRKITIPFIKEILF